jgi:hypothetical protein
LRSVSAQCSQRSSGTELATSAISRSRIPIDPIGRQLQRTPKCHAGGAGAPLATDSTGVKHLFWTSQYSRLGNRSYRPLPLRSAFLSTLKPFLEVVGDPFVRFQFAFKGSDIFYMAVRPLGRDVPNVVHGVSYLQCWDLRRRRVGHWVVFTRIAAPPAPCQTLAARYLLLTSVSPVSNAKTLSSVPGSGPLRRRSVL